MSEREREKGEGRRERAEEFSPCESPDAPSTFAADFRTFML